MSRLFPLLLLVACSKADEAPVDSDATDLGPVYGPDVDCGERSVDASVIRWPYLQDVRPDQGRVVWGTDNAKLPAATLHWGPDDGLGNTVEVTGEVIPGDGSEIALQTGVIEGLSAGTQYCYAVEVDGSIVASGLSLRTAPDPRHTDAPISFTVLGDYGKSNEFQRRVRDQMLPYADRANLHITVGDNAYSDGNYDEWQRNVFTWYHELWSVAPIYPTTGNHDYNDVLGYEPYVRQFFLPENAIREADKEIYWSADFGSVHFVSLDTEVAPLEISIDPDDGDMLDWLRADLAATDRPWKIVTWHHPPFSEDPSRNGHPVVAFQIMPILQELDVDLALMGHDHFYVRYHPLIDGDIAADEADPNAVHYVMTGGGGAEPRDLDPVADDRVTYRESTNQFLWVEVADDCTLTGQAIDGGGTVIDSFTIDRC